MLIQVTDLIFEYPGFRALNKISFTIEKGSITALVGPNGAGKTTLMRCLAALEQPLSGSIEVDGIDVLEYPRQCHRKLGYLSDFFGLYDRLTVRQILRFIAGAQGIPASDWEQAVERVSRQLQIHDRLEAKPNELSRGLRQRVAIAQAIIHQPQVVLLDEPASGLDPEARYALADLFLDLQRQGMTLLVSSHILAELESYSSHMLILREGRIIEHVNIRQHHPDKTLYRLVLAHPDERLAHYLADFSDLDRLKIESNLAIFEMEINPERHHQLLKTLFDQGLPVCEFAPAQTHLQDTYLARVQS